MEIHYLLESSNVCSKNKNKEGLHHLTFPYLIKRQRPLFCYLSGLNIFWGHCEYKSHGITWQTSTNKKFKGGYQPAFQFCLKSSNLSPIRSLEGKEKLTHYENSDHVLKEQTLPVYLVLFAS